MLLFPLLVAIHFCGAGLAENSEFSRLEIKQTEAQNRYCRVIFNELVKKVPDLGSQNHLSKRESNFENFI